MLCRVNKVDGRNIHILISDNKYEVPTFYLKYARNLPTFFTFFITITYGKTYFNELI